MKRSEPEGPTVIVVRAGGDPVEWQPPDPTAETGYDVRYWGGVLAEARKWLTSPDVRFVLTFERNAIPIEGDDVAVLAVGDDDARMPAWSTRVLITFKTMGLRPERVAVPRRHPGAAATALGLAARNRLRHVPGKTARAMAGHRGQRVAPVHELPLGYFTQLELPLRPIAERPFALSFDGSVRHWKGRWGDITARMAPPKVYARRRMLEALEELRRHHPHLPVHLHLERGFFNVSPVTGRYDSDDAYLYSRNVMDAKLLLAPQGTNPETSRHFQGLRAGCVVVTDVVPDRWYLRGAPLVVVSDWDGRRALRRRVRRVLPRAGRRAPRASARGPHE